MSAVAAEVKASNRGGVIARQQNIRQTTETKQVGAKRTAALGNVMRTRRERQQSGVL